MRRRRLARRAREAGAEHAVHHGARPPEPSAANGPGAGPGRRSRLCRASPRSSSRAADGEHVDLVPLGPQQARATRPSPPLLPFPTTTRIGPGRAAAATTRARPSPARSMSHRRHPAVLDRLASTARISSARRARRSRPGVTRARAYRRPRDFRPLERFTGYPLNHPGRQHAYQATVAGDGGCHRRARNGVRRDVDRCGQLRDQRGGRGRPQRGARGQPGPGRARQAHRDSTLGDPQGDDPELPPVGRAARRHVRRAVPGAGQPDRRQRRARREPARPGWRRRAATRTTTRATRTPPRPSRSRTRPRRP